MSGADRKEHAGFADFQAAQAVDHGQTMNGEFPVDHMADFAHLGEGHRLIGLVLEVQGTAPVRFRAHKAIEGNDGAVGIGADTAREFVGVDGLSNQSEKVIFGGGREHFGILTSAHGWEKSDGITFRDGRVPSGELFIARGHQ